MSSTEQDLNNVYLRLKLDEIGVNARGGKKEKNRAFKNLVTQEEIDEYRKELEVPYEVGGVKYKYSQVDGDVPDLDEYTPLDPTAKTDEELALEREDIGNISYNINVYLNEIETSRKRLPQYDEAINNVMYLIDESKRAGQSKYERRQLFDDLKKIQKMKDLTLKQIEAFKKNIEDDTTIIENIQRDILENENKKSLNQAEFQRVKKENQAKVNVFKERLTELNRGTFNVEQQPNETEEEYLQRMDEVAKTPYDDTRIQFEAEMFNLKKLKKNLKELIKSDSTIENTIKSFTPEDIFQLNKIFPILKTKFLETFGYNNKAIRFTDLDKFLKDGLYFAKYGKDKETTDTNITFEEDEGEKPVEEENITRLAVAPKSPQFIPVSENIEIKPDRDVLIIKNITTGKKVYIRAGKTEKNQNKILASPTGEPKTFLAVDFRAKDSINGVNTLIINYLNLSKDDFDSIFGDKPVEIFSVLEHRFGLSSVKIKPVEMVGINKQIYGFGVSNKVKIPKGLVGFGRVNINLDKLYYKNILSVKDKSGFNIPSLVNTNVSDKFVEIIMKHLKNEEVKQNEYKALNSSEKELFNQLIYLAGFQKEFNHTGDKQIEDLKNRLELIEGEIQAGNNNEENLKDLYNVLMKLVAFNVLGIEQARKHYKNIKKDFF